MEVSTVEFNLPADDEAKHGGSFDSSILEAIL
jgi:hypothetical protein